MKSPELRAKGDVDIKGGNYGKGLNKQDVNLTDRLLVSTSDGTRKEGIGVEGLVRGGGPEGEERGRRGATVPLTPPKSPDNADAKQVQGV